MAKKYIMSEENASEIRAYRKGVTENILTGDYMRYNF